MRRFFYATNNETTSNTNTTNNPRLSRLAIGTSIALTESIVHHWCRVLRANVGDKGILFDGFGGKHDSLLPDTAAK